MFSKYKICVIIMVIQRIENEVSMNKRTLYKLEFNKIKDRLATFALTDKGKEMILEIMPSSDFDEVLTWQKETSDAINMAVKKGRIPIGRIQEVSSSIKRVEIGAVLSCQEILNIANVLKTSRLLKRYYREDSVEVNYKYLESYFERLAVYAEIEHEIAKCIIGPDEFADDATPELAQIRKQIKSANNKIRETIHGIIHSSRYQDMLQEPVVTIRQDRYCVPVKVEYKNAFKGIVHDQSSTGATVFMEPASVVELNNQLKLLFVKEQEEIEKILIYLTELIAGISLFITDTYNTICELDLIFARAEFSLKIDGREPKLNTKGYINLKRARHPLLPVEQVVPIDIYVGEPFTTLLITGPTTGGKTLSLKTVGLFTLMVQSGMQIPAAEGSEIAVFD